MRIIRPNLARVCIAGALLLVAAGNAYADHDDRGYWRSYPRYVEPRDNPQPRISIARNDDWNHLTAEEQRALNAHQRQWDNYSPQRRERLRSGAQRYLNLTPEQRNEVQRGRERYERMSPEERQQVRDRYRRSRGRDD